MAKILAVDDEEDLLETIAYNLERAGHQVTRARSASAALSALDETTPDLIISDIMMPGMDGLAFCATVRERRATALTPFLFVTAKGQPADKFAGLSAGADDYVTKPFDLSDLLARVGGRLQHRDRMHALERELDETRRRWVDVAEPEELAHIRAEETRIESAAQSAGFGGYQVPHPDLAALKHKVAQYERRFPALAELRARALVGEAPAFLRVFEDVLIAAASPDPVLVLGETGTGKTAIAEAIWRLGARVARKFRTINCSELAAGDPTIAIGKLFGYGRGSGLPGVSKDGQPGLLDDTDGGVLFMDEVGDLPRQAQTLLLLPLEGRAFRPAVGTGADRTVSIKFVCATNRDLAEEVAGGRFPRDLYERFAGHVIRLPGLRERPGDVPLLCAFLLRQLAVEQPELAGFSVDRLALAALADHDWPGNVRELRRVIRQAAQRAQLDERRTIGERDLPPEILATIRNVSPTPPENRPRIPSPPSPAPAAAPTDRSGPGWSEREAAEIAALREAGFRVGEAEAKLGYSSKSRTFSHRLRGLSLKALALANFDLENAARFLAGSDEDLGALARRRLRALLDSMAARLDEPDEKTLANLLLEHRPHALATLERLRQRART